VKIGDKLFNYLFHENDLSLFQRQVKQYLSSTERHLALCINFQESDSVRAGT